MVAQCWIYAWINIPRRIQQTTRASFSQPGGRYGGEARGTTTTTSSSSSAPAASPPSPASSRSLLGPPSLPMSYSQLGYTYPSAATVAATSPLTSPQVSSCCLYTRYLTIGGLYPSPSVPVALGYPKNRSPRKSNFRETCQPLNTSTRLTSTSSLIGAYITLNEQSRGLLYTRCSR